MVVSPSVYGLAILNYNITWYECELCDNIILTQTKLVHAFQYSSNSVCKLMYNMPHISNDIDISTR